MFSTTGLFKDISCPYFLFGLCERPFCHFKHSKHEEAKARIEAEKTSSLSKSDVEDEYKPPTSSLQRTLQEIENSIQSEKRKLGGHDDTGGNDENKTKVNCVKNKPTGTPEYNPTPLCELKKKKVKEKLGRSKYDLALLDEPSAEGEYDPASNFSTDSKLSSDNKSGEIPSEALPDYANVLQGVKRPSECDGDNSDGPLAKIPKFVSVEYTPTVNDSVEYSDEEATGIKGECFSEDESDICSDSERLLNKKRRSDKQNKTKENKMDSEHDKSKESLLPIEFTSEGFVKSVYVEQNEATKLKKESVKKVKSNSGKKHSDESKNKTRKNINIFALFEDEFDSVLENCESKSVTDKTDSQSNVKLKQSSSSSKTHQSSADKSGANTDTKHKSRSHHKGEKHLSSKSHDKSSSSSHKSKTKPSSSRTDKDSDVSHKHKESNATSKHRSSSSKDSSSSKHNDRTDKLASSSSRQSSSLKSDHKSLKHGDHKKTSHSNPPISNGKYSHSSSKHKEHSDRHSSSNSKHGRDKNTKKQHIMNLDVDLFSCADSDLEANDNHNDNIDDLSDLEKYFVDEDPFDECLRIFNEENADRPSPSSASDKKKHKKTSEQESATPASGGKKRVALKQNSTDEKKRKVVSDKPTPRPSPAQVMMNRFKKMQEQVLKAEQDEKDKLKEKVRKISKQNAERASTSSTPSQPNMSSASSTFTTYMANKNKKTTAITVSKGGKRKAHTPTVPIAKLKRPTVEISSSSKVASNVRQRYLNLFIDECIKIYPTEKEAFKKGKEEEEAVFKRCSNKKIYLNFAVNTIKRLRTAVDQKKSGTKAGSPQKKLSHAAMLAGAGANKATYTLHRSGGAVKVPEEDFTGADLYKRLQPYVLSEEQLKLNNFPHPDSERGGTAVFYGEVRKDKKGSTKGYEKLCVRCGKIFEVYPNGKYPVKEECVYHWGKAWKKKIAGSIETRYTCCQGDLDSEGCQVAKLHVHEANKTETMTGFMKTIPSSPPLDGDYGVYALDCEMVYTTMGIELARVTVVGADEEPAYESLVRPDNPVINCNTRFSGITDEDLEDVQTSLRDVQAVLLSLFTDKTILIGHSLESDLIALKLFHFTVVDTSVVFPHRMGYPFKRALRNLMAEYLKKIIQDDVGGHDSLEDALACIQLMQYKLKEDAKREGRGRRLSS